MRLPIDADFKRFGFALQGHCVARTCSTSLVPMPKASAPTRRARMMSFAETPGCSCPLDADFKRFRFALQEALRGEDVFHFAGADAEGQRAERAVRGRVAVTADDGHARLCDAQLRPDDVHDALMRTAQSVEMDAVGSVQFCSKSSICLRPISSAKLRREN